MLPDELNQIGARQTNARDCSLELHAPLQITKKTPVSRGFLETKTIDQVPTPVFDLLQFVPVLV
jgi:hypothetical protein